jgi:hypothetical protein
MSCDHSVAANSEYLTQFHFSAPEPISWQAGVSELDCCKLPSITLQLFYTEDAEITASIAKEDCSLIRCLAICVLIVARVGFSGNVFTEPLPSNGYARHNM